MILWIGLWDAVDARSGRMNRDGMWRTSRATVQLPSHQAREAAGAQRGLQMRNAGARPAFRHGFVDVYFFAGMSSASWSSCIASDFMWSPCIDFMAASISALLNMPSWLLSALSNICCM